MTYIKLEDAVKAVEVAITCNGVGTRAFEQILADDAIEALRALPVSDGWEDIATARDKLLAEAVTLRAKVLRDADDLRVVKELLVAEREENLWNAYHTGHEKDGEWTHMCMSDGEWLAQQCGLDPKAQFYNAADVKALIPNAARAALGPLPAPPSE